MAHNVLTAAYSTPAWHGLGYVSPDGSPMELNFAYEQAGWGYEVEAVPKFYTFDGTVRDIPGMVALVRADNGDLLGEASAKYEIFQNHEIREFIETLVHNQVEIHAMGVLGKGEKVWCLGKIPGYITVRPDDVVDQYLLIVSGHDGKTTLKAFFTGIRVVCQNTLTAALRAYKQARGGVSIHHKGNLQEKVKEAQRLLGISTSFYKELADIWKALDSWNVTQLDVSNFLDEMVPLPELPEGKESSRGLSRAANKREKIITRFEKGAGNVGRSAWDLYNGFTEFVDYDGEWKQTEQTSLAINRFESTFYGVAADEKARALNVLVDTMAGGGGGN